jgi:A/G-specific adenine glycosylase
LVNLLFSQKIITWFQAHQRNLPWRHTTDPYFIWLSEIILQQTRVAQGLPYYLKFTETYPTVFDLAAAPEQEVMRLWQGLGYYSRARSLHQTAQYIVENLDGLFPNTYNDLLKLKGIGPYTAAAIASFAYNEPVAVVDGNVFRVLARVFGIETDIASNEAKKQFTALANELLDKKKPATFNQAIMEFGAIQCQPIAPDCLLCPLQNDCVARLTGQISVLPVKDKKIKIKKRFFDYLVFRFDNKIALSQRTDRDIWQQLFDFQLIESTDNLIESIDDLLLNDVLATATITAPTQIFTHILTHQRIKAQFWQIELKQETDLPTGLTLYSESEFENLPKPVLITNYWKTVIH